ncbi:MAG: HD domain-containing protein [bacterium]
MTIQDVYAKYHIMPQLATHMLRVAGVGKLIVDGWKGGIDRDLVMRSLLLHDMGNIVKFDLGKNIIQIENLEYWKKIQAKYREKYGTNAHEATTKIVAELGQDDTNLIMGREHAGYASDNPAQLLEQGWGGKILSYCDVRVVPTGVTTLKKRIEDLQRRYGREMGWYDFLYKLEEQVRRQTNVDLDEISEEDVEPLFEELLTYTVQ